MSNFFGMPEASVLRLFFALWPSASLAGALHEVTRHMHGRAMNLHGLHVTVAFLGPQLVERIPSLCEVAERYSVPRETLCFNQLQYWSKQLVVAVPSQIPPALHDFALRLHAGLRAMDLRVEPRSWNPHITLLRNAPGQVLPEIKLPLWTPDALHLVASDGKGNYRTVHSWPTVDVDADS